MITNPLVSVIVPVYNVEKYLKECLDSIIAQSYPNIEILCVDDGSTDSSPAILKNFQQKHPGLIKVFTQHNQGQGLARNRGLDEASGEYVLFVDSDDFIMPDTAEKCVEAILKDKTEAVYFHFLHYDDSHGYTLDHSHPANRIISQDYPKFLYTPSSCLIFFKMDVIRLHNIKFTSNRISEDWLFNAWYITKIKKITILGQWFYGYRANPTSTHRKYHIRNIELFESIQGINNILKSSESFRYYEQYFTLRALGAIIFHLTLYYNIMPKDQRKIWMEKTRQFIEGYSPTFRNWLFASTESPALLRLIMQNNRLGLGVYFLLAKYGLTSNVKKIACHGLFIAKTPLYLFKIFLEIITTAPKIPLIVLKRKMRGYKDSLNEIARSIANILSVPSALFWFLFESAKFSAKICLNVIKRAKG